MRDATRPTIEIKRCPIDGRPQMHVSLGIFPVLTAFVGSVHGGLHAWKTTWSVDGCKTSDHLTADELSKFMGWHRGT